jgi:F0F1-type ATP synthase epsilon subunit
MELSIITPTYKKLYAIAWIELETTAGNFVIQPGHAPTILLLTPNNNALFCLSNGKQESVMIKEGGIAHIERNSATLLLNL